MICAHNWQTRKRDVKRQKHYYSSMHKTTISTQQQQQHHTEAHNFCCFVFFLSFSTHTRNVLCVCHVLAHHRHHQSVYCDLDRAKNTSHFVWLRFAQWLTIALHCVLIELRKANNAIHIATSHCIIAATAAALILCESTWTHNERKLFLLLLLFHTTLTLSPCRALALCVCARIQSNTCMAVGESKRKTEIERWKTNENVVE